VAGFQYNNRVLEDVPVASDSALKQTIDNLLDNALEASPEWVGLDVRKEDGVLHVVVTDRGPGFPAAMLGQIGKPYQSTKADPGHGLGLFLAVNVARKLGGAVTAANRPEGGAQVSLSLPLSSIAIEEERKEASIDRKP
jgi:two-component system sensor histidine kinase RegB